MKFRLFLAMVALLCGRAEAARWTLDPARSHLGFSGVQSGARFEGQFRTFSAEIDFDPAHPEAAHVTVSVVMASAATGDAQRDASLPEPDWFDAKMFPQARFEASGFQPTGKDAYLAQGKLTLRGVEKPLSLPFTLVIDGETAQARGQARLLRTDFGVGQGEWGSGDDVALEVGVSFDISARKAP